ETTILQVSTTVRPHLLPLTIEASITRGQLGPVVDDAARTQVTRNQTSSEDLTSTTQIHALSKHHEVDHAPIMVPMHTEKHIMPIGFRGNYDLIPVWVLHYNTCVAALCFY